MAIPLRAHESTCRSDYDSDFYKWTGVQAKLLKEGKFKKIDLENLIEEIESLGKSERRSLKSHLINLLKHLLKLEHQSEMQENSNSWNASVENARLEILLLLEDSPSLKNELNKIIEVSYKIARGSAKKETGLPLKTFPSSCPWEIGKILKK